MTKDEKVTWLKMWLEIDGDGNNKMDYNEYLDYFNMTDCMWTKRVFEIMNYSYTGVVNFVELITFCSKYLTIDKYSTQEFGFRLISRRGSSFLGKSSILDASDFQSFLNDFYHSKNPVQNRKRAMDIFTFIDIDGDGGIDVFEFGKFCDENPTILKFTHTIQQHLRKCIFGIPYWVDKSRKIKMAQATGFNSMTTSGRINMESEKFTVEKLKQPVIDKSGYAIASIPYVVPQGIFDDRKYVSYKGPFDPYKGKLRKYEDDFSEIFMVRQRKKAAREKEKRDKLKQLMEMTSQQHDKMIVALDDLISGKFAKRIAFERWTQCVGLESKPLPPDIIKERQIKLVKSNNNDDNSIVSLDTSVATVVDIHEKVLELTKNCFEDENRPEKVCDDYLNIYLNKLHHSNVIMNPNRVRDLQSSVQSMRSTFGLNATDSRPTSRQRSRPPSRPASQQTDSRPNSKLRQRN